MNANAKCDDAWAGLGVRLSRQERRVAFLMLVHGLSTREAARALGLGKSTVQVYKVRAIAKHPGLADCRPARMPAPAYLTLSTLPGFEPAA